MGHGLGLVLRTLRRRPLHAALVVGALALGLGASLAVFTVADAILLRPLPFPSPGRLVTVTQSIPTPGFPELDFPGVTLNRIRSQARSLEGVAGYQTRDVNLLQPTGATRLVSAQVSPGFLEVLRIAPALGRDFTAVEDLPGGPRAVLLSSALWRAAFGADPGVVGTTVSLEGEPFTIAGVMPPWFALPSREVAIWEPLRLDPAVIDPGQNRLSVIARLRAGATLDGARAEVTAIIREVGREYPGPHPGSALDPAGYHANMRSLADAVVGDPKPVIMLLLVGALLLLLLTCANVVNLQLAGVIARRGEIAIRVAIGASRRRLIGGALLEGTVLTAIAALLGLGLATAGASLLARLLPMGIASSVPLLGARTLTVVAAAVLVIGAVVGAVPVALVAGRSPSGLQDRTAAGGSGPAGRFRRALAVAQVALAVVLLHGSGLLIASAGEVQRVTLGFRPDSAISVRINLPAPVLGDRTQRELLLRRILQGVDALPGVEAAGLVNALPLELGRRDQAMAVEGRPFRADGSDPLADYRVVSHGYFAAMGIPLVVGRLFTDDDANATYTPIVISRSLGRLLFPDGEDPLGQRLRFGPVAPWMPIVGVVEDVRNRSLTEPPRPEFYTPGLGTFSRLAFRSELTIVARSRGDARALAGPIRDVVREVAPEIASYQLATLDEIVREARARMTTATRLMSGYAIAALLLAVAGTYALLAYLVSHRRQELAIRLALGADGGDLVRLVARESVSLIGLGLVAGAIGAALSSRLLAGLLYGVGRLDPVVALAVILAAGAAGVGASLVPARRATRVDPGLALRSG